jgi:hypothetical protein
MAGKTEAEVQAIKRRHSAELLDQPGVSGVGVEKDGDGEFVLTIYVDADDPAAAQRVPARIEGCPVRVVRGGPFRRF